MQRPWRESSQIGGIDSAETTNMYAPNHVPLLWTPVLESLHTRHIPCTSCRPVLQIHQNQEEEGIRPQSGPQPKRQCWQIFFGFLEHHIIASRHQPCKRFCLYQHSNFFAWTETATTGPLQIDATDYLLNGLFVTSILSRSVQHLLCFSLSKSIACYCLLNQERRRQLPQSATDVPEQRPS